MTGNCQQDSRSKIYHFWNVLRAPKTTITFWCASSECEVYLTDGWGGGEMNTKGKQECRDNQMSRINFSHWPLLNVTPLSILISCLVLYLSPSNKGKKIPQKQLFKKDAGAEKKEFHPTFSRNKQAPPWARVSSPHITSMESTKHIWLTNVTFKDVWSLERTLNNYFSLAQK